MAGINRTTLTLGPGHLLFGGSLASKLYCSNIAVTVNTTWANIMPGGFGRIDRRKVDETITIKCTPIGELSAAIVALLWPYGSTAVGDSLFGATDTAMGIQTLGGQKFTFHCCAITKMPPLRVGAGLVPYGDFEITAILKLSTDRTNATALYTLAAASWAGQPTASNVVMLPAAATWALGAPETIVPKAGWEVDFEMQADPQVSADFGTFDMRFRHIEARAKCLPIGYSEARLAELKLQDTGNGIGSSTRVQADLTIAQANPGLTVVLKNASFDAMPMQFGDNLDRMGEVAWIARRDIASGYGALFSVGVTPV